MKRIVPRKNWQLALDDDFTPRNEGDESKARFYEKNGRANAECACVRLGRVDNGKVSSSVVFVAGVRVLAQPSDKTGSFAGEELLKYRLRH